MGGQTSRQIGKPAAFRLKHWRTALTGSISCRVSRARGGRGARGGLFRHCGPTRRYIFRHRAGQ